MTDTRVRFDLVAIRINGVDRTRHYWHMAERHRTRRFARPCPLPIDGDTYRVRSRNRRHR